MSTTDKGREAEALIADELKMQGHTIKSMNWRTRWCEIDIVSIRKKCVFFTEVKLRTTQSWGSGFDYIGAKKLQQMAFAAEFWISENNWRHSTQLLAAEVDGSGNFRIVEIS